MELHIGSQKDSRRHKKATLETILGLGIKIGMLKLMSTQHNETTSQFNARDHTINEFFPSLKSKLVSITVHIYSSKLACVSDEGKLFPLSTTVPAVPSQASRG